MRDQSIAEGPLRDALKRVHDCLPNEANVKTIGEALEEMGIDPDQFRLFIVRTLAASTTGRVPDPALAARVAQQMPATLVEIILDTALIAFLTGTKYRQSMPVAVGDA